MVFFQGLDEHEAVAPVPASVARRSATGGYRRWEEAGGGQRHREPRQAAHEHEALTQREWTEWKEQAARERLRRAAEALAADPDGEKAHG